MIDVPSRIDGLIQSLEAGNEPSADQLRRVAALQALDLAKAGEEFVRECCAEEDRRTKEYAEQ